MKDAEENPEGPIRIRGEGRHRFRPFRFLFHHSFAQCFHSWLIMTFTLIQMLFTMLCPPKASTFSVQHLMLLLS
jgi:hypothetical protein